MRLASGHRVGVVIAALLTVVAAATLFAISQRFQNALEHQRIAEDIRKNVTALHDILTDQLIGRGAQGAELWQQESEQLQAHIKALTRLGGRAHEVELLSRDLNFATAIFTRLAVGVSKTALSAAAVEELRAQQGGILRAATESLLATAETVDKQARRILDQLGMALGALTLGFALLLLASLLGYMTIIRIRVLRPLEQLGATMASVGEQGASSAFRHPREDELGDLSRGFNAMLSQLGAARDALVRKTAESTRLAQRARMSQRLRYQALLIEASHEAIIVREFGGRVLQWNRGAEELYAIHVALALGKPLSALIQSQALETGAEELAAQLLKTTGRWHGELRQHTLDGRELMVDCEQLLLDIRALPREEEEEEEEEEQESGLGLVLEVHHDITARKRNETALRQLNEVLESTVAERTTELRHSVRELERSNQALQEFAAIAAHDLQSPLRIITSFSGQLRESLQNTLSEKDEKSLTYVIEGGARMQAMTRDLLAYAKVTASEATMATVELEGVLEEVMAGLRVDLDALDGTLSHDPLPRVQGVRTEYLLVLRNLIGNALKFHGTAAPHIHVRAETQEGGWRLAVEDNGIGFDPKYQARIFQVFRRLHTAQRYPGTGMGLALIKRIVEFRGGSVGVDSTPGLGSKFWFTIPASGRP